MASCRRGCSSRGPMGQAISYARDNWEALVCHTEFGFLAIDKIIAEREMKKIAIGRKNFLFVGSDRGSRTAAVLFSFTSTCQRHNIDPFAYRRDVIDPWPPATCPVNNSPTSYPTAKLDGAVQAYRGSSR